MSARERRWLFIPSNVCPYACVVVELAGFGMFPDQTIQLTSGPPAADYPCCHLYGLTTPYFPPIPTGPVDLWFNDPAGPCYDASAPDNMWIMEVFPSGYWNSATILGPYTYLSGSTPGTKTVTVTGPC